MAKLSVRRAIPVVTIKVLHRNVKAAIVIQNQLIISKAIVNYVIYLRNGLMQYLIMGLLRPMTALGAMQALNRPTTMAISVPTATMPAIGYKFRLIIPVSAIALHATAPPRGTVMANVPSAMTRTHGIIITLL